MGKTVRVYKALIERDSNYIEIDLPSILNRIFTNRRENSLRKIENYPSLLNFSTYYNNDQIIGFSFFKYREDYKPYTGELFEDNLTPIDKTLVEVTNMIYCTINNCLLIEYNQEGHREKDFEKYINSFLPEGYKLFLNKVINRTSLDDVLRSGKIRYLELKFNLNSADNRILNDGFNRDIPIYESLFNVFGATSDLGGDVEANFATCRFDLGNKKGTLNLEAFRPVIEALNLQSDRFESAKVKYEKNGDLREVDLKQIGKPYTFKILENSNLKNPGKEFILNEIKELYINSHFNTITNDWEENIIPYNFDYNSLILLPSEEFKVEIINNI